MPAFADSRLAVSIDITSNLICEYPNKKYIEVPSTRFDFINESDSYEFNQRFSGEQEFLENLLEIHIDSLPAFELTIYYKNVLGAFFKAIYMYRIYPFDEDIEIIKNWLKKIKTFEITFSERIRHYDSSVKRNPDGKDSQIIFDEIKSEFENSIQEAKLEVVLYLIPGSFNVKPISDEEYNSEIAEKSIWYGMVLGPVDKKKWLEMKKKFHR